MMYAAVGYHCIRVQVDSGGESGYGKGIPHQNPPIATEDTCH